jgi:CelD/BcsL family acetyltransferase involved in cellulose biosynthesis
MAQSRAATKVQSLASTSLPLPSIDFAPEAQQRAAAVSGLPAMAMRALDWPCCAAPSIVQAWDALAQAAVEPNPFHESWYLLPALRALDAAESVKMLVFEVEGRLCGMLPLRRETRYYGKRIAHLAGWTHPNCFLGAPLVAPAMERAFWKALLEWADHADGKGLFLHLSGIPLDSGLHAALVEVLAEQNRSHGLVHREERAMLASVQSPEDYFTASLSGKKRKELRRQLARLSGLGKVDFKREYGADGLDGWLDAFLTLEQAGWKGAAGSALASREDTQTLFCESLAGAAAQGVLERLTLTLDGQPIAMLANFLTPPGAFSYKTAFDESYARFSPGVLLQCENLLLLDQPDIAWTDSCASADHPMIDHIWRERRAIGRCSIAIGGKLRRAAFNRLLRIELGRNPTGLQP